MPWSSHWRGDLRDAGVLARTELRAVGRRLLGNRRRAAVVGVGSLSFIAFVALFTLDPAVALGRRLAGGDPPPGPLGALCSVVLLTGVYFGAATAINPQRIGTVGPLVRTSIPPRAVAAGRIASELVQVSTMVVLPLTVGLIEVAVGARGLSGPLLLGSGLVALLVGGTLVGRTVGALARYGGFLARLSTWTKVLVLLVVTGAVFVASQLAFQTYAAPGPSPGPSIAVPPVLPGRPLQAYAGLVLAPVGGQVTPTGVLAATAVLVAIPVALAVGIRTEARVMLTVVSDDGPPPRRATNATSRPVPRGFARWPSTRMAWRQLLRSARDPTALAHLFPIVFGAFGMASSFVIAPGAALGLLPPAAVVGGAVLAGATYCLNPLGDDRDQLALVLTSAPSTGVLLRGRAVAGSLIGLVLAVGVGTPLAALAGSPAYAAGMAALAVLVVPASAGAALGLGAVAPRFERRDYMNVERAHPSQIALLGFFFGDAIVVLVGVGLVSLALDGGLPRAVVAAGWIAYIAVVVAAGWIGYRYAVRRFDALTLADV